MTELLALGAGLIFGIVIGNFLLKQKFQKEKSILESQIKKANNQNIENKTSNDKVLKLENHIKNLQSDLNKLTKEYSENSVENNQFKTKLRDSLEEKNLEINKLKENIETKEKEILNLKSKISIEQQNLNQINNLKENIEVKQRENEDLKNQLKSVNELKIEKSKKSILMVDDSAVIRASMKKLLLESGFNVVLAKDGIDALEMLNNSKFDLIITDLEMPNLDGFGLMSKISENKTIYDIPILVITGHEEMNLHTKGSDNFFGVFKKPWDDEALIRKIKFLCA